ncbi:MAG: hypothetical protein ACYC7D_14525 [Nitrososphaerales archaeon]
MAVVTLYFLNLLAIQSLLVVWNVSIVLGIVAWEKEKAQHYRMSAASFSQDERWSSIEREIQWTQNQLKETYSQERRQALQAKLLALRNQKRKLEWKMKEESLDALYNSSRSIRELDKFGQYSKRRQISPLEDPEEAREKSEKLDRKSLDGLLHTAEEILKEEPEVSLHSALNSVSNDMKAHYNDIKKRDKYASSLADYWVGLMIIQAVMAGSSPTHELLKYASRDYTSHFSKLLQRVGTRIPQTNEGALAFNDREEPMNDNDSSIEEGNENDPRRVTDS